MGKVFGGILGTLVIVFLISFLLSHFGILQWGNGNNGDAGDIETEKIESEEPVITDEIEETTITIIVTQDKYLIDEQEVTLTQIRERVTDESVIVKVVLEDNYASTKAWDDIKTSLAEWGIIPIEQ